LRYCRISTYTLKNHNTTYDVYKLIVSRSRCFCFEHFTISTLHNVACTFHLKKFKSVLHSIQTIVFRGFHFANNMYCGKYIFKYTKTNTKTNVLKTFMISCSSPFSDNHPRVNNDPQGVMDIYGWLSHKIELQLIINL